MNKKILYVLVILAGIFIASCSGGPAETKNSGPITIGVDVFPGWAHVFIAKEKGFFEKNGVDVKIVLNEDYLTIQDQFANEELDGAFMVYADAIYANDKGVDTKVVYISDHSIEGDVIVAKPEFESFEDLKGKTISVEGINSFSHLFVLAILEKNGMKEGDVFIENVRAQEVVKALDNGDIVAGHTYGPGKFEAMERGYKFLAYAGDVPGIITDTLAFNSKIVEERPDEIKAIVKSLFEAKEFQKTNREEALQILSYSVSDSLESIGIGIDSVKYLNLAENFESMHKKAEEEHLDDLIGAGRLISDFFLNRGQISSYPDLDEVIEGRFVNELFNEQ